MKEEISPQNKDHEEIDGEGHILEEDVNISVDKFRKTLNRVERELYSYGFDNLMNAFFYNYTFEFKETLSVKDKGNFENDFLIAVSANSIKKGEEDHMTFQKLWRKYSNEKSKELLLEHIIDLYNAYSQENKDIRDDDEILIDFKDWGQKQKDLLALEVNLDAFLEKVSIEDENVENEEQIKIDKEEKSFFNKSEAIGYLGEKYEEYKKIIIQEADKIEQAYKDIFPDRNLNKEAFINDILNDFNLRFSNFKKSLPIEMNEKSKYLLNNFIRTEGKYNEINLKQIKSLVNLGDEFNKTKKELFNGMIIQDGEYAVLSEMFGDPDKYNSPSELNTAIESGEIIPWWMDTEKDFQTYFKKIDSNVLKNIIISSKKSIRKIRKMLKENGYNDIMDKQYNDRYGEPDPLDVKTFKKYENELIDGKEKIRKAKRALSIQEEFEKILNQLIHGSYKEENIDGGIARKMFEKYEELIEQAKKTSRDDLKEFFMEGKGINDEDIEKIVDIILKKANKFLEESLTEVLSEGNESKILEKLNSFRTDTAIFGSIFQIAYKESNLDFEEIKGIDYMSLDSKNLGEKQKEMIRKLVKNNYPRKKQREDILEKIEESFNDDNSNSRWHLLLKEGGGEEELLSCIRFDEIDDNNVYGASFNVDKAYQGFNIGEAMNKRVLDEVAKDKKIHAIAEIQKKISKSYINNGGFNVSGIEKNNKTGIYYYDIERYDLENEFYSSKRTEDEVLMSYYSFDKNIEEQMNFQKYILVKKENKNFSKNIEEIEILLGGNYLLTKIIDHQKGDAVDNYYVFEKKIKTEVGAERKAA